MQYRNTVDDSTCSKLQYRESVAVGQGIVLHSPARGTGTAASEARRLHLEVTGGLLSGWLLSLFFACSVGLKSGKIVSSFRKSWRYRYSTTPTLGGQTDRHTNATGDDTRERTLARGRGATEVCSTRAGVSRHVVMPHACTAT